MTDVLFVALNIQIILAIISVLVMIAAVLPVSMAWKKFYLLAVSVAALYVLVWLLLGVVPAAYGHHHLSFL